MKSAKNITYTSTLSSLVMEEVVTYSKKMKVTRNKVIEKAIVQFLEEEKRKKFEEGFKKMGGDHLMKEIAEEGMKDYQNQLKKY